MNSELYGFNSIVISDYEMNYIGMIIGLGKIVQCLEKH